jgi:hypothetical protein
MGSLTLVGWINGISASALVIFGVALGLFIIYKANKTKAKLLYCVGSAILFLGLGWLGNIVDFIIIISTGSNIANPEIYIILSMVWFPPAILSAVYVGSELLIPEKKRYIIAIYVVLGVMFELFLFLDTGGSFTFVYPSPRGSDLIDESMVFTSPLGIIFLFLSLTVIVIWGLGFSIKALQSSGAIRKNFLLMSIGSYLFTIFGILDTFGGLFPSIVLVLIRIGILSSFWIIYFGFVRHLGTKG